MCSYVEQCAKFKNQTLKNWLVHKSALRNGIPRGYAISKKSAKIGVPLRVYIFPCNISSKMQILAAKNI